MRIGFLVSGGVDRSGTHRVVPELLDLLQALSRRHEVHVVAMRQEARPGSWRIAGADVWNVGSRPRRVRALMHLRREHRASPFHALVGYALVPQGAVAVTAGRLLSVPSVVAAPGGEFVELGEIEFGGWRNRRGRFWVRLAVKGSGAVVVPSEPARLLALERGVEARRIPLPLSHDSWPRGRDSHGGGDVPRLAWVGSLNRVKDPGLLVDTVRHLRSEGVAAAVDVVGEDFSSGSLQRRVTEADVADSVTFHGFLPQAEVRRVLQRAALLLVTSRFEGGSRAVLEAASLGVPTVGTAVGYVKEWSPDSAVAVEHATPVALGAAVRELLDDADRRRALGARALARLAEHDTKAVADAWESIFEEVADEEAHGQG